MFALILVTGLHAFAGAVAFFAAGVAVGYAFRGKEHAAIVAAGQEVSKVVGDVAKKV